MADVHVDPNRPKYQTDNRCRELVLPSWYVVAPIANAAFKPDAKGANETDHRQHERHDNRYRGDWQTENHGERHQRKRYAQGAFEDRPEFRGLLWLVPE